MPVIAVVGPTASGKSALANALCRRLGGELVSCDSMQIYRGMDIGTAKPTVAERAEIPHHMIDILDPADPYSAADYAEDAARAIREIAARGKRPVLCGGTGLYLSALRRGPETAEPVPGRTEVRQALEREGKSPEGRAALLARLQEVDPASAAAIHPNNLRRIIRALEIYEATGIPKSEWDRRSRERPPALDIRPFGLCFHDRARLYRRIEARVDEMMARGLYEEVCRLARAGALAEGSTAAQAIGYKELARALRGEQALDRAVADLKTATRRYAKRQMTWFLSDPSVTWLYADRESGEPRPTDELLDELLDRLAAQPCLY